MESLQERIRNEEMKNRSPVHSYYEIPWSFGSQEQITREYIEELNKSLGEHNLIANAIVNENEHKLVITLKAFLEESNLQALPVHIIEMPLDEQERPKRSMNFVMHRRMDQKTEQGKNLREFLEKISIREIKQNWKLTFKLEILPSAIRNVSHNIGNEIGSALKTVLIETYRLIRLRKLMQQDSSQFAAQAHKLEARKMYTDHYQGELDEIESSLSDTTDEKEIIQLKKQKAALQKKYILDKLKQTEE